MMNEIFSKVKPCFGTYENYDMSWHCKGCPIKDECESQAKEKTHEQSE